ncbi:MAG: hypothetical protein C0483_08200 [Pirellula sp.]|nr:hypothetical protein [Pirellula sp.]
MFGDARRGGVGHRNRARRPGPCRSGRGTHREAAGRPRASGARRLDRRASQIRPHAKHYVEARSARSARRAGGPVAQRRPRGKRRGSSRVAIRHAARRRVVAPGGSLCVAPLERTAERVAPSLLDHSPARPRRRACRRFGDARRPRDFDDLRRRTGRPPASGRAPNDRRLKERFRADSRPGRRLVLLPSLTPRTPLISTWLSPLLLSIACLTAAPIVVVLLECAAALLPRRSAARGARPRVDVLVPAHNEERVLAATLRSVQAQLRPGDRILVVADNCTDGTADVARTCGAGVAERRHETDRGKGFALDFGVRQLNAAAGDVVVIVDADCTLGPGALDALAGDCAATGRPIQAGYVMHCPPNPSPRDLVSRVAVTVKNIVRQRGATTLGGPAILTGSGMAFPWETLRSARLASGNIVEDMQLSFDLVVAGHAPRYCAEALVTASLPSQGKASTAQRTRWEHGHLQTLLHRVPRLAWLGLRHARPQWLFAALDLAVPPLSLLVALWCAVFAATAVAAAGGYGLAPFFVSSGSGVALLLAMAIVCRVFLREVSLLRLITAVPRYVVGKLPIYVSFLVRRQTVWVRTDRGATTHEVARPHLEIAGRSAH